MKILRLSLQNLASIQGIHHIDFQSDPLSHAGLIAITGKTGAGKSTLLDAMCLALYDQIPRLTGAAGTLQDASGQAVSIKDSKNLLRRGCTQGFAELEFIALDQKRYIARWEIRRARNKTDGTLKVDRAVIAVEDQRTLTQKISECTPLIEKLVGLSFEQFTRAVLLAQSEVGAFLKAKDQDRADLLEYLTNSHIFSIISQKAFEKSKKIRAEKEKLQHVLGHIELLDTEQLDVIKQQHQITQLQLNEKLKAEKALLNDQNWYQRQRALQAEIQVKQQSYQEQIEADRKILEQKNLLKRVDLFQEIRDVYLQRDDKQTAHQQVKLQQQQFSPEFAALNLQVLDAQRFFDQENQNLQQHIATLDTLQPAIEQGLAFDKKLEVLLEKHQDAELKITQISHHYLQPLETDYQAKQSHFEQATQALFALSAQLQAHHLLAVFDENYLSTIDHLKQFEQLQITLEQELSFYINLSQQELENQRQDISLQIEQITNTVGDAEKILHHQKQYQVQVSVLQAKSQQLEKILSLTEQLSKYKTQQQDFEKNIQQQQDLHDQLHTDTALAEKAYQDAKHKVSHLNDIFNQQRLLQAQSVQELRAQLVKDHVCMVCGSQQHPFVEQENLLENALAKIQDVQLGDAKNIERLALEKQQNLQANLAKTKGILEQNHKQYNQIKKDAELSFNSIEKLILSEQISIDLSQTPTAIITQLSQLNEEIKKQIINSSAKSEHYQQQHTELQKQQRQQQDLRLVIEKISSRDRLIRPIFQHLDDTFKAKWQQQTLITCQKLIAQLQTRKKVLDQQQKLATQVQQLEQQLNPLAEKIKIYAQEKQCLIEQNAARKMQGSNLRQTLIAHISQSSGQQDHNFKTAKTWQLFLHNQIQTLQQTVDRKRALKQQIDSQLQQAQLKQQSFISKLGQLDEQISKANENITAWQARHADFDQTMIEECRRITVQDAQNIRHLVTQHQDALMSAKSALETLQNQQKNHQKDQPSLDFVALEQALDQIETDKATLQELFNQYDAQLRIHAASEQQYAKFQSEIEKVQAEENRWGRIDQLIGSKEGKKFQKVAQEHHLDILIEYANQQLQPLSARYQLKRIPDSLGLAIIDLDMNSEIRPVLSLSGGETFLVSLALALAIASMASGSMKLDSLFIDEGFGTLDPASLHTVMNALDHLQSQGRKVILISHVQEMHERIPVQIQVKSVGAGASKIEIIG